ncbi:MAG: Ribosomal RNA small subunit methyltransferase B [Firmicutes bacterium ADurb.Bin193]|nr:MAG: Ribosomal RNA small subunit methyltransferase B [Firmicutes bacterium ADurb.Bin193]
MNAREAAVLALFEVEKNGAYSDLALKKILGGSNLSGVDRAFATELVYGVIRHKLHIDYNIKTYSSQKLNKLSVWILNILRISIYQLIFLDKIPQSAAVNEGVKLAKRYGHDASSRFVNAVLRAVTLGGEIKCPSIEIFYSHPKWLVTLLSEQYPDCFKKILASNNEPAPVTIRANSLKTTDEALCEALKAKGIKAVLAGGVLEIKKFGDISALSEYKGGLFTPQDRGAFLAAAAVEAKAGELIIDVCAAPGGKTTQLAEQSGDNAEIIAFDLYPHKTELIEKNACRLGIKSITALCHNSSETHPDYVGRADKVLADVPCSGLGIIRKKPDIKWTKSPDDIKEIIEIQKKILAASAKYLKKGGVIVYSTCTVNKEENSGVTDEFIKREPFEKVFEIQLLPHRDNCDGFYICKMIRR